MKPCPKCSATERYANGHCAPCARANTKAWRAANPEKCRANNKAWRTANPEKHRAAGKAWNDTNPVAVREQKLNRMYGITTGEYNQILATQDSRCPICKQPDPTHLDHDHETGRIRGILHRNCNTALGMLGDSTDRLHAAVAYLAGVA